MKTELERYKEALEVAMMYLGEVCAKYPRSRAEKLEQINAIIHPMIEYAEVEKTIGWLNIYDDPDDCVMHTTREDADSSANANRIDCREICVKVKRPVPLKKPVTVKVEWARIGNITYPAATENFAFDWAAFDGKTGTLTFLED